MRFFQRLDVQLSLIFVAILSLTVSLTGWIHTRGHSINLVGPYFHLEDSLRILEPQLREFENAGDVASLTSLLETFQRENPGMVLLVVNQDFRLRAQTTPENSIIELVRRESDSQYFVVATSSIVDRLDFLLFYQMVPALDFQHRNQTHHLLMIPEPWVISPPSMRPILLDGVRHHFGIFGWFYAAIILFFVLFIRWRLRPLRRIEAASNQLTKRDIPAPIAGKPRSDEVGRLVQAFNDALRRLSANEATRRRMVSDIAHELRTPLTNLSGRIEAYEDKLIHDADALIGFASAQVESLTRIVNDLALLSSSDAGELVLQPERFPLKALLEDLLSSHNLGGRYAWQVEGEAFDVVLDRQRFRQILQNLIDNALKAKPEGLVLKLSLQRDEADWLLCFEDNGPGVSELALQRLFERLYRPDDSRSSSTGGSGLGLSIVESLVEVQQGEVSAYAVAAGGLGFRMRFPNKLSKEKS